MRLELGCGKTPRAGYTTCDVRELPHVDYVCTADNLPFEQESIEEIYSRHLVEHFGFKQFLKVLEEWNRVLKTGGKLYIICPNVLWHIEQILKSKHDSFYNKQSGKNDRYWGFGSLFGWQQDEHDIHKFGYYFDLMQDILEEFGFSSIENLTNSGKGVENKPWHLEVCAVKLRKAPAYKTSELYNHFDVKH